MPETDPNQFNALTCIDPKLTVFITQGFRASYLNYEIYQYTINREANFSEVITDQYGCAPDECSYNNSSNYLGDLKYNRLDKLTINKLGDFITTSEESASGGSVSSYVTNYSGPTCPPNSSGYIKGIIDYGYTCVENSCGHVECTNYNNCNYNNVPDDCHEPGINFGPCGVAVCSDTTETSGNTIISTSSYGPNIVAINNSGPCCPDPPDGIPCAEGASYSYVQNAYGLDKSIYKTVYGSSSNIRDLINQSAEKRLSFIEKPEMITSWDGLHNRCSDPYYPCGPDKYDCWEVFLEPKSAIYGSLPYFIDYYSDEIYNHDTPYWNIPPTGVDYLIKAKNDPDIGYSSIWKFKVGIETDRKNFNKRYKSISGTVIFYIDSDPVSDPCCMNLNDFTGTVVTTRDFELTPGSLDDFKNTYLATNLGDQLKSNDLQEYVGLKIKSCIRINKIDAYPT